MTAESSDACSLRPISKHTCCKVTSPLPFIAWSVHVGMMPTNSQHLQQRSRRSASTRACEAVAHEPGALALDSCARATICQQVHATQQQYARRCMLACITQQLHSSQCAYRGSDLRDKTGVGVGVWVMALPLHAVVA